ncbi:hypothetical protein BDW02DRAFT_648991 [Decorospora gaudefroyi]|uniref:F-box domain-containing protein n=1 Tax=Decorospora gaudefroyi TaxID=184978 RepID=A0A6A5KCF2_9PLEO|nr:hypothetical protein BDW02DRAFT_648991 [Decorospora gaudefroyi]
MADEIRSLTDLPVDVLDLVFPYLDAKSFLALCSTCRAFQQPSIRLDSAYWSYATRSTFRVPNQHVVQHDGLRWQKMYRRLLTQSRVFTWGSNSHNRLGHAYEVSAGQSSPMPRMLRMIRPGRRMHMNSHCAFPVEMENTRNLGVIADMQCGGWSTTLLTSTGSLHTVGVLDGQRVHSSNDSLQPLRFPAGYPSNATDAHYAEPTIAIRQFSAGRSHILALSDSGRLWSWYNVKKDALQVKFLNMDIKELPPTASSSASASSSYGQIRRVVAGWSRSSAFIDGIGIVVWDPVERDHDDASEDTMLVMEYAEVPNTAYRRVKGARESDEQRALGEAVGVVLNYILLEHFVVLATETGKVFCGKFGTKNQIDNIIELRQLRNEKGPVDVQGSFRSFATFKNNEVLTTDQNYLEACWGAQHTNPDQTGIAGLRRVPALQGNHVISVAFGDYHYLALHSDGKITSYGTEIQACGALGLGNEGDSATGQARGVAYDRGSGNGYLLPHAYTHGRQVWFDARKREWLEQTVLGNKDPEEAKDRRAMYTNDRNVQGEVSEWFEQEGRAWDQDNGEDGLGAYFALGISAAGWHSGALVLVNEELANKEPTYDYKNTRFPRLKLTNGTEMPGEKEFDAWRQGMPQFQLDSLT